jgi:hypothetical protein
MSRRPGAGALAGIAMILLLAAPAAAAAGAPRSLLDVPRPAVPPRDVVLARPSLASAGVSATASTQRYPIDDGRGSTIEVSVTASCRQLCSAADPQQLADFVGTLVHGSEVNLLRIRLETPGQVSVDCGFDADSCYYSGENLVVLSGDPTPASDGATREFVLAHEYGHHVAQHRRTPAPFPAAINWGPERWASYERVCQGYRRGAYYPGNEGSHYFEDPGEAWAESFAHNRFPNARVKWRWAPALRPDAGSFAAIRRDVLDPWHGRRTLRVGGELSGRGSARVAFDAPSDGRVNVRLGGRGGAGLGVSLRSRRGRRLHTSRGISPGHSLSFTACGQHRLEAVVRGLRPRRRFQLVIREP